MLPSMRYAGLRYTPPMDRKTRHLIQHLEHCQRNYERMEQEGTAPWSKSTEQQEKTNTDAFAKKPNRGIIEDVDDYDAA